MLIKSLEVPYIINNFDGHNAIKEDLLNLINNSKSESLVTKDDYYQDNISRLDWERREDWHREWVKKFLPLLQKNIDQMINKIGFENHNILCLWYQQYLQGGAHGWHVHGDNYTGVYYLELPEGTPTTEYCNPLNVEETDIFQVKEGDIILFPSFVIHRAIKNLSNKRKTIISFNINLERILRGYKSDHN